jgi:hypothetical protein
MDNEFLNKDELGHVEQKPQSGTPKTAGSKKPKKQNAFVQILNGEFLSKEFVVDNLNFIFFVLLLMLLIVTKGYYGKQLTQDVDTAQKELNAITTDYVEAKARLEESTRRYRLVQKLESKGLHETMNALKVIRLKKEEGGE